MGQVVNAIMYAAGNVWIRYGRPMKHIMNKADKELDR